MPRAPPEHHLPIPSSRSARRISSTLRQYVYTIRDNRRGLFNALIYLLRFLRFLRNDLGVKTSDWWGRWLDQVKDAPARSKSSNRLPSLCSTQRHNGALRQTLTTMGRETYVPGNPVSHRESLRTECMYSRLTHLRKKRNKRNKTAV